MDELTRARVSRTIDRTYSERDLTLECAGDFGRLLAKSDLDGLPEEVGFELAKEHFKRYGAAMVEFGELVTPDMCRRRRPQ